MAYSYGEEDRTRAHAEDAGEDAGLSTDFVRERSAQGRADEVEDADGYGQEGCFGGQERREETHGVHHYAVYTRQLLRHHDGYDGYDGGAVVRVHYGAEDSYTVGGGVGGLGGVGAWWCGEEGFFFRWDSR